MTCFGTVGLGLNPARIRPEKIRGRGTLSFGLQLLLEATWVQNI